MVETLVRQGQCPVEILTVSLLIVKPNGDFVMSPSKWTGACQVRFSWYCPRIVDASIACLRWPVCSCSEIDASRSSVRCWKYHTHVVRASVFHPRLIKGGWNITVGYKSIAHLGVPYCARGRHCRLENRDQAFVGSNGPLVENHRLVAIEQNPMLANPLHCRRQHVAFNIASFLRELLRVLCMVDSANVLLDNGSLVQIRGDEMRGSPNDFDAPIVGLVVRLGTFE